MANLRMKSIETRMRELENQFDRHAGKDCHFVARLDGRGFGRLVRKLEFERPFDERFRDALTDTARHLMNTGFKISYAYTQSDEISLLFDPTDHAFGHKYRKLLSVLAGDASAVLSMSFGTAASVDCRLLELDSLSDVGDYFAWRQSDANRNCLQSHLYWSLRQSGQSSRASNRAIVGLDRTRQKELLQEQFGIDYDLLPSWQRLGMGLYHETFIHDGLNPLTGQEIPTLRRRIKVDSKLPSGKDFSRYVEEIQRERVEQEMQAV